MTDIFYTKARPGTGRFDELSKLAEDLLGTNAFQSSEIITSVLDELEVKGGSKAKSSAVSPLTMEISLLQDGRGVTNKRNPANIALIIEQVFALGGGQGSAASCLVGAYREGASSGLPKWLQTLVPSMAPDEIREIFMALEDGSDTAAKPITRRPAWLSGKDGTPFFLVQANLAVFM